MEPLTPVTEYASILASLLHDIGKVLQRLGLSKSVELINSYLDPRLGEYFGKCVKEKYTGIVYEHERYTLCFTETMLEYANIKAPTRRHDIKDVIREAIEVLKALILRKGSKRILELADELGKVLGFADVMVAAERGPSTLREHYSLFHRVHGLDPRNAPFISPLWLWHLKNIGLLEELAKLLEEIDKATSLSKVEESINSIKGIVEKSRILGGLPLAINPKPIKWGYMVEWSIKPGSNEGSVDHDYYSFKPVNTVKARVDYREVVEEFLRSLTLLLDLALKDAIDYKGFVETLASILKYTMFFVPAGVYGAIMPDTSLYAHSKAMAAIVHAYIRLRKTSTVKYGFNLLGIDLNRIQWFIRLIAQHKAASKLMRGKSFYVELLQRAVTSYLLSKLGLTWINVVGYEGGKVYIIKPLIKADPVLVQIRELEKNLLGELGITIAESSEVTSPIKLSHLALSYMNEHDKLPRDSYAYALLDLTKKLVKERYSKKYDRVELSNYEFDRLTHTPTPKNKALLIQGAEAEYLEEIAPGAFTPTQPEEYFSPRRSRAISPITHNALVLGHVSRNLVAIVELMARDHASYGQIISSMVSELNKYVSEEAKTVSRRTWNISLGGLYRLRIGLVEYPELGIAYLLISLDADKPPSNPWSIVSSFFAVHKILFARISGGLRHLRFIIVNKPENMLPEIHVASQLIDVLKTLVSNNVSISFDYWFTNTYHPIEKKDEGIGYRMKDLDEITETLRKDYNIVPLLSLAKMDGDHMGELFRLIAPSPSRFITLSELLQFYFGGLSYALIEKHIPVPSGNNLEFKDHVVVLYGGGDDIAVYGSWLPVIYYVIVLRIGMDRILYPLTASSAIIVDDPKTPIALNYQALITHLEKHAKEFDQRDSTVLFKEPLPHIHEYSPSKTTVRLRYGIKGSSELLELKDIIEEVLAVKPESGIVQLPYQLSVATSQLLERELKYKKIASINQSLGLQPTTINELLTLAIRLQYDYNRRTTARQQEGYWGKKLDTILKSVYQLLSQGKALQALLEANRKLPQLAIIAVASRK